jgi:hypothetical protein
VQLARSRERRRVRASSVTLIRKNFCKGGVPEPELRSDWTRRRVLSGPEWRRRRGRRSTASCSSNACGEKNFTWGAFERLPRTFVVFVGVEWRGWTPWWGHIRDADSWIPCQRGSRATVCLFDARDGWACPVFLLGFLEHSSSGLLCRRIQWGSSSGARAWLRRSLRSPFSALSPRIGACGSTAWVRPVPTRCTLPSAQPRLMVKCVGLFLRKKSPARRPSSRRRTVSARCCS